MIRTTRKSAVFAMLLGSVLLYAQAASATRVYVTIEGAIQGTLKGNANRAGLESKTEVLDYGNSFSVPSTTGTARAKREHGPVRITKVLGAASPQLFQALITNEALKSVVIDFVNVSPTSGQEYLSSQIKLTNARIASIEHKTEGGDSNTAVGGAKHSSAAEGARILEMIELTFATIEIISHDGKTSAADSIGNK